MNKKLITEATDTLDAINSNLTIIGGQLLFKSIEPDIALTQIGNLKNFMDQVLADLKTNNIDYEKDKSLKIRIQTVNRNFSTARNFAKTISLNQSAK